MKEEVGVGSSLELQVVVEVLAGSSAAEVAAELRSRNFTDVLLQSVEDVIGLDTSVVGEPRVVKVYVEPLAFTTKTTTKTTSSMQKGPTTIEQAGTTASPVSTTIAKVSVSTLFLGSSTAAVPATNTELSAARPCHGYYAPVLASIAFGVIVLAS